MDYTIFERSCDDRNLDHRTHSILKQLLKRATDRPKVGCSRIASVLVYRNRYYFGYNSYKTHPYQAKYGKNPDSIYLHAEIDAIKKAKKELEPESMMKSVLYVARVKGKFDELTDPSLLRWGLARPCQGCQKAIITERVGNVIFTTDDSNVWTEWAINYKKL